MPPETPADVSLAVLSHPRFTEHRPPGFHPERPRRLEAAEIGARRALATAREAPHIALRESTREELECVHDSAWLDRLERTLAGPAAATPTPWT